MPLPIRWRYKLDRWRESFEAKFRSQPKVARPRLCPACSSLVGATASKCHQCGASLHFSLAAASRSLSSILPTESPVTYCVLGINMLLFIVALLATMRISEGFNLFGGIDGSVLSRLGASRIDAILAGQWWRLVMAIFLHGSILHIAMNTWVLMDIGPQVEELYGSARFLVLYVLTGAFGYVLSALSGHFSVGASGALMGLIGLMIAVTSRRGGAYMQMMRAQLIRWVVYIFVLGILVSGIDNAAHLGGLAAGFVLGRLFADREPMDAAERKRAYALGWMAGLVVVASFALMLMNYFRSA